ncbi:hypothetical protein D9758_014820 [Tetrapyrgos nigripes]|uniref:P-loop containing nucleoside triphosphate hydrolase protein n=1 Tax=Tetrapyrgos nigripes TaxID=182062 RepID=A0A8H5C2W3_9AGAR|nr:hypothetical protein D9758_014820 [Tetrapyrgos nigripes]
MDALKSLMQPLVAGAGGSSVIDGMKLVVIGGTVETARRMSSTAWSHFVNSFFLTAHFSEEDYPYDWLMLWLSRRPEWQRSREFETTTRSTTPGFSRIADNSFGDEDDEDFSGAIFDEGDAPGRAKTRVVFQPTFDTTHTIYYRGHWLRVRRSRKTDGSGCEVLTISVVARNNSILKQLVLQAKREYEAEAIHRIQIYFADQYGSWRWTDSRHKRPMNSIVLNPGVKEMLLNDTKDFLGSEKWYADRGIPFRRGYLLHGVPGSGKSSLIHAIAGELMLDIYVVSLSSSWISDATLNTLMGRVPKRCIVLLEDLDAAFTRSVGARGEDEKNSKEKDSKESNNNNNGTGSGSGSGSGGSGSGRHRRRGLHGNSGNGDQMGDCNTLSLSGLLNALDGVAAAEGRILFATTNHLDHLDPALSRPGRMDVWIDFKNASKWQAEALFRNFFPCEEDELKEKAKRHRDDDEDLESESDDDVPRTRYSSTGSTAVERASHSRTPSSSVSITPSMSRSTKGGSTTSDEDQEDADPMSLKGSPHPMPMNMGMSVGMDGIPMAIPPPPPEIELSEQELAEFESLGLNLGSPIPISSLSSVPSSVSSQSPAPSRSSASPIPETFHGPPKSSTSLIAMAKKEHKSLDAATVKNEPKGSWRNSTSFGALSSFSSSLPTLSSVSTTVSSLAASSGVSSVSSTLWNGTSTLISSTTSLVTGVPAATEEEASATRGRSGSRTRTGKPKRKEFGSTNQAYLPPSSNDANSSSSKDSAKQPGHSAKPLSAQTLSMLAKKFADGIPEEEFSVAALQGYLLRNKTRPWEAAEGVKEWVEKEREEKKKREGKAKEKEKKEKEKKQKEKARKEKEEKEKERERERCQQVSPLPVVQDGTSLNPSTTVPEEQKTPDPSITEVVIMTTTTVEADLPLSTEPVPVVPPPLDSQDDSESDSESSSDSDSDSEAENIPPPTGRGLPLPPSPPSPPLTIWQAPPGWGTPSDLGGWN